MDSEDTNITANTDDDQESTNVTENNENSAFSEKYDRLGFIRKVHVTLLCQFLVTILVIVLFLYIKPLKRYSRHSGEWIWITALVITILTLILFTYYEEFPNNVMFLGIFTLCESTMLGAIASHYDEEAVLLAVGITAGVCFGLVLFSFQTKVLSIFLASLGALLFSFYFVIDAQMMLRGKHKYSLSPEDYAFAALNLYIDGVMLFFHILSKYKEVKK